MKYQELKKEILEKEYPKVWRIWFGTAGAGEHEYQAIKGFISHQLDEVASAVLAAGEIEVLNEPEAWIAGDTFMAGKVCGFNDAREISKRRSDEWLGKNNET